MKLKRVFLYNAVIGFQMFLALMFQLVFAKKFGVSHLSDAYFVGGAIFTFLSFLTFFFTNMFLQYYNDIKVDNEESAKLFYQAVLNITAVLGGVTLSFLLLLIKPIVYVFAPGFDLERTVYLVKYVEILGISFLWYRVTSLNNVLINAEMRFLLPYVLGILGPIFNIMAVVFFANRWGINAIAFATVISSFIIFAITQYFVYSFFGIKPGFVFWHRSMPDLFKKSFSLRLGYQILNFKDMIATNFLSQFEKGAVSYYFYALKIIVSIYNMVISPIGQIYNSKISKLVSEHNILELKKTVKEYLILNGSFLFIALLPVSFFLKDILEFFFKNKFSVLEIQSVYYMFLTLIPFVSFLAFEMPFVNIAIANKEVLKIIKISILYIAVYFISLLTLKGFGVFSISFSLIVAHFVSFASYFFVAKDLIWKKS